MLTQEQLELRKTGVGGSQSAAGCGMSPWQQSVELYLEKIGEADEKEITEAMLIGQYREAGDMALWSALRGKQVRYPLETKRHPDHPFILATGDAEIADGEGLEFKNMNSYRYRNLLKMGFENVAPEYVFQAQQQMMVYGWRKVTVAILVDMKVYDHEIEANPRLQRIIVERLRVFWDYVERREPPPVDFSRAGALRAVQALYPDVKNDGAVIRLSEDANSAWEAYESCKREEKAAESKAEGYRAFALAAVGDNYAGLLSDGRMLRRKLIQKKAYSVAETEYWDFRAVKFDGSDIVEPALPEPREEEAEEDPVPRIDFKLQQCGFLLVDTSPSGSRYYLHRTEPVRVRLADHPPNDKTAAWMDRQGIVREIRTDLADSDNQLMDVLNELESVNEPAAV